jgi:hypothetical protein
MDNYEVNKIIAEFMGYTYIEIEKGLDHIPPGMTWKGDIHTLYTKSLDSLVPVWEKLKKEYNCSPSLDYGKMDGHIVCFWTNHYEQSEDTISDNFQEAAAHATAKAIISLGDQ